LPLAALKKTGRSILQTNFTQSGPGGLALYFSEDGMAVRGVRGATTIDKDEPEQIHEATRELLTELMKANAGMRVDAIASALFTVTEDIVSAFPAQAARQMGWTLVPMMCAREIPVPGSLPHAIRVLIHWNTDRGPDEIQHIYLREAVNLRPDLQTSR
jgi:chorismate mutase